MNIEKRMRLQFALGMACMASAALADKLSGPPFWLMVIVTGVIFVCALINDISVTNEWKISIRERLNRDIDKWLGKK
jgi:hypothetical protein